MTNQKNKENKHNQQNKQDKEIKRLYKDSSDKILSGVCSGIANYLETDPTLIRVGYVLLTFFTGFFPGLIAYIVLAIIVPEK